MPIYVSERTGEIPMGSILMRVEDGIPWVYVPNYVPQLMLPVLSILPSAIPNLMVYSKFGEYTGRIMGVRAFFHAGLDDTKVSESVNTPGYFATGFPIHDEYIKEGYSFCATCFYNYLLLPVAFSITKNSNGHYTMKTMSTRNTNAGHINRFNVSSALYRFFSGAFRSKTFLPVLLFGSFDKDERVEILESLWKREGRQESDGEAEET